MKKLNDIISHFKNLPEFNRLDTFTYIRKLIDILPPRLKQGVKFAYIKNETLFFVLNHPLYKKEFETNANDILSLAKKYEVLNVNEIKFFVSHTTIKNKEEDDTFEDEKYKERSYGIFENHLSDEKLYKKFENIRNIIKKP